jgi:hypothetical protein
VINLIRQATLRRTVSGVFVVAAGIGLLFAEAEAAPVMNAIPSAALPDVPVVAARTTCWWQGGRRVCHRRPVRQVCWWSHGRRVCTWR